MANYYYDLHIHSSLSPCSSDDMTPNNIVNMAILKKLDIIALTDHNSAKNIKAIMAVAKKGNLLVIPGVEIETVEGIHLLCYFHTIEAITKYCEVIYQYLPNIINDEIKWGRQLIIDEDDYITGKVSKRLLNSVNLSIDKVIDLVQSYQGIVIPAHITRYANSIITILGFIPKGLKIAGVELSDKEFLKSYQTYRIIVNSDAHNLGSISEKHNKMILPEKSIAAFFAYFGGGL